MRKIFLWAILITSFITLPTRFSQKTYAFQTNINCCYSALPGDCGPDQDNTTVCAASCQSWIVGEPQIGCSTAFGTCQNPNSNGEGTCDCNCAVPPITIQCIDSGDCINLGGGTCISGRCSIAGSNTCDPNNASPGSDCFAPAGPCDPNDPGTNQPVCTDSDNDGVGQCICNIQDLWGSSQPRCTPSGSSEQSGIKTPFGCLPFDDIASGPGKATVVALANWSISIGAGIALFIIIFAALQITTASGDPKRLKAGQELLFSGLSGIFLITLAIVVLNFIGVKILGLDLLGFII